MSSMYHVIKWYHLVSFMKIIHLPATIHHRWARDTRYQSEDFFFFERPFYQCLGFKMPIKDDLFLLLDVFCSRVAGILSMKIIQELCGVSEKERCNAALCPRSWKVNSVESARWSRAFNRDNLLVEDYTKSKSNW